jgi:hypothetical protein
MTLEKYSHLIIILLLWHASQGAKMANKLYDGK